MRRAAITASFALTVGALVVSPISPATSAPTVRGLINAEFGTGWLGQCFASIAYRESHDNPSAANWRDHHSDGSRGSFGLLQIGALWRRPGESVGAFARRMWNARANLALGHELYRRYGLAPWGSC